jgi:hypothetical protein
LGARGARRRDVNRRSARRDGFPAVAFDAPSHDGLGECEAFDLSPRAVRTSEAKAATSGVGTRCVPDGALA